MNPSSDIGIVLSWQRASIAWQQGKDSVASLAIADDSEAVLPELPDENMHVQRMYLPMEKLLSRVIQFPFDSPALVDADMLFQRLSDEVDVKEGDWWLAWHLEPCQDGVSGMVFGLSEDIRAALQEDAHWQSAKAILVDGFERLQRHRCEEQAAAIIDQDTEGLFIGFFDGEAWQGMRRINTVACTPIVSIELFKSLQAMGFDAERHAVTGVADANTWQLFEDKDCDVQGDVVEELNSRHTANLELEATSSPLNFRHGRWSAKQAWQRFEFWQRSIFMMLAVACIWYVGTWAKIQQLDHALELNQQRIESAFHQALPNEKVMLDALAQLKQAAGSEDDVGSTFLSIWMPLLKFIGNKHGNWIR